MSLFIRVRMKRRISALIKIAFGLVFAYLLWFYFGKKHSGEGQHQTFGGGESSIRDNLNLISRCESLYGSILIIQFVSDARYARDTVHNALQTVRCYAQFRGYELLQIVWNDGYEIEFRNVSLSKQKTAILKHVIQDCRETNKTQLLVLRHCVVRKLLPHYSYVIHLDADTGIVNPSRCIEEFVEPGVNIHLQLRFKTGEIQAGHYILRNSSTADKFLSNWLHIMKEKKFDQTFLHTALADTFLPSSVSRMCAQYGRFSYWRSVKCVVTRLRDHHHGEEGNNKQKTGLLIYARAHGFARDGWLTGQKWSDKDFMLHAMKEKYDVLFKRKLHDSDCLNPSLKNNALGINNSVWNGRIMMKKQFEVLNVDDVKHLWKRLDRKYFAREEENAIHERVGGCWPYCNHLVV